MRTSLLAALLALFAGSGAAAQPSAARVQDEARAVYAAVLESVAKDAPEDWHRYVQEETELGWTRMEQDDSLHGIVPGMTPALLRATRAENTRVLNVRALTRREGVEWISRDSVNAMMRRIRENGGVIPERFTLTRFSAVGFSQDGTTALLYVHYFCGIRCGEAYWALLTRQPDGRWIVSGTVTTVQS